MHTNDDRNEKILFISNHQSTGDVPLMFAMFSNYWHRVILWVMDGQFKLTNFGVVSLTHGDFFITPREFKAGDLVNHCQKHSYKNCFILFPEGKRRGVPVIRDLMLFKFSNSFKSKHTHRWISL